MLPAFLRIASIKRSVEFLPKSYLIYTSDPKMLTIIGELRYLELVLVLRHQFFDGYTISSI